MLELLRTGTGICSRKVLQEGLQQVLYDFIIKGIKGFAFEELTDLLEEASWMSELSYTPCCVTGDTYSIRSPYFENTSLYFNLVGG